MNMLRIMSNNIWWCDNNLATWEAMGEDCSAKHRVSGFIRLYEETQPDIIGLQECSARMAHLLMTGLVVNRHPYALLWGRNTPILYRSDKFELVDSDVLIYPEEIPGLEGCFNDLQTKSYCIAVLRLKETGKLLIFATTHLMYKSGDPASPNYMPGVEEAKSWQLNCLMDRLDAMQAQYGCGAVIVGDFNTWPSSLAVRTARERGFLHAHDLAAGHADDTTGMHFCYASGYKTELNPGDFTHSIDHILLRGVEGTVNTFTRYCPDWYYPLSDHSPAWIDLEF